jgi:mRNA interferase HicA
VKRLDLIRALEQAGCVLERHGARHDWYRNPATGVAQAVPRHREINDHLARRIIRELTAPPPPSDLPDPAEPTDPSAA